MNHEIKFSLCTVNPDKEAREKKFLKGFIFMEGIRFHTGNTLRSKKSKNDNLGFIQNIITMDVLVPSQPTIRDFFLNWRRKLIGGHVIYNLNFAKNVKRGLGINKHRRWEVIDNPPPGVVVVHNDHKGWGGYSSPSTKNKDINVPWNYFTSKPHICLNNRNRIKAMQKSERDDIINKHFEKIEKKFKKVERQYQIFDYTQQRNLQKQNFWNEPSEIIERPNFDDESSEESEEDESFEKGRYNHNTEVIRVNYPDGSIQKKKFRQDRYSFREYRKKQTGKEILNEALRGWTYSLKRKD